MPHTPKRLVLKPQPKGAGPLAPTVGIERLPAVEGVLFAAAEAGVKYQNRLDVMLVRLDAGSAIAGVFTQSATRSAPVLWCETARAALRDPERPITLLANSGNSNAFTGHNGFEATKALAQAAGEATGCAAEAVFPASTGVIGEPLPYERIIAKLADLNATLTADAATEAAQAIMTTDTYPKGASLDIKIDDTPVRIMGFAKGSGMIAPDMATMLVYIFTDAVVAEDVLQDMLSAETQTSFNAITVDGDTSTSDTLLLAATGKAGHAPIRDRQSPAAKALQDGLSAVMRDLAHQVVRDGEGATKFVEITVTGATSNASAHRIALSIANSPLVKTAVAGADPNWGRIIMAIGKAGEPADRDKITLYFGDILVAEKGWVAASYREADGAAVFAQQEISLHVDLGLGDGKATVWTCDLTHGYISINADYRS